VAESYNIDPASFFSANNDWGDTGKGILFNNWNESIL
jgi:hypothetical protein